MFESTIRFLIIIIFLSSIILFVSLIKNTEDTQNNNDLNIPFPKFSLTLLSRRFLAFSHDITLRTLFFPLFWAAAPTGDEVL